jgi:hypothetical protein
MLIRAWLLKALPCILDPYFETDRTCINVEHFKRTTLIHYTLLRHPNGRFRFVKLVVRLLLLSIHLLTVR